MELEDLKGLYEQLKGFTNIRCTGCDTCTSTNEICMDIINLKLKINKRIKEIEDNGRSNTVNG